MDNGSGSGGGGGGGDDDDDNVAVGIFGGAESLCATITFFFKWMNSVV